MSGDETVVLTMLHDGQVAIFEKLEVISKEIKAIPVQENEIGHINKAIERMDARCAMNHKHGPENVEKEQSVLLAQIWSDLARASALLIFCVMAYTCFVNVSAWLEQKHSITVSK